MSDYDDSKESQQGDDLLARVRAEDAEKKRIMEEARKKFDTTADSGGEEYEYFYGDAVNPWLMIWIRPAYTMRYILDNEPWYGMFIVAILAGMGVVLANHFVIASEYNSDFQLVPILVFTLSSGGIAGLVGAFFWGYVVQWIGTVMGGKGSSSDVIAAMAWSRIPEVVLLIYALVLITFFMQEDYFIAGLGDDELSWDVMWIWLQEIPVLSFVFTMFVCSVWGIFIRVRCLAEAQQYTTIQAFFNLAIAWGVVVGFLSVLFRLIPGEIGMVLAQYLNQYVFMML